MIGSKLKKYRQNLKVTGETLANLAGIKRSWLSQIENEKKYPPVDTFINLVDAIARISVLNNENSKDILTEEAYQEFRSILDISAFHNSPNDEDYSKNLITEENVQITGYHPDFQNIGIEFTIKKSNVNDVNSDEIDEHIRPIFFEEFKEEGRNPHNIYETYGEEAFVYELSDIRQSLYEWWYNYILKDFYDTFNTSNDIVNEEMPIFSALNSLINPDGTFTPDNNNNVTNIQKSLLNEKIVTFDISYIRDKNLRLTLDGKLLSNQEVDMLDVSLSAIRYKRIQK